MCGLFGLVATKGASTEELADLFGVLSVLNTSRGSDSYGVWHGTKVLARAEDTPAEVILLAREALARYPARPLCGHTRLATRGRPTAENAHPFAFAVTRNNRQVRYVAAHNGGVSPSDDAPDAAFECYTKHAVDSAAFFSAVFEHGVPADAWEGYGTFVWCVSSDAAVQVGCAETFELAMVTVDAPMSGPVTIWSSEEEHLRIAIRACLRSPHLRWHDLASGQWRVTAAGPTPVEDTHRFSSLTRRSLSYFDSLWGRSGAALLSCDVPSRGRRRRVLATPRDVRPIRSNVPFVPPTRRGGGK